MKEVLFFAVDGLICYIFGYVVGKLTTEQKFEEVRKELNADEEGDLIDELFK